VVAPPAPRLLTRQFALLAVAAMLFFASIGATLPVLPRYVRDVLGGSDALVGFVVSAFSISAVLARPALGHIGDRHGRRWLLVGGGLCSAVAMLGHVVVESVVPLVALRLLVGVGQGAVMVGATTMAVDLAPLPRRGEAASYVLVSFQVGIGGGPIIGELVFDARSFDAVWLLCAAGSAACAAAAYWLPGHVPHPAGEPVAVAPRRLVHAAGLVPGLVLGLGVLGYNAFLIFVPLFGEEVGLARVAPIFLLSSSTVVAVRLGGARIPDRLGPVRGGTLALTLLAVGLTAMGLWQVPLGLYLTTVVVSSGSALLFPSLVTAAVAGVPESERSSALATFTMFLDISAVTAGVAFGAVATVAGYGTAFVTAGCVSLVALLVLRAFLTVGQPARAER
jgi:MFS family permease